jgi:hypothetical protein
VFRCDAAQTQPESCSGKTAVRKYTHPVIPKIFGRVTHSQAPFGIARVRRLSTEWRSLGESNPCFSLERANSMPTPRSSAFAGVHTSFGKD